MDNKNRPGRFINHSKQHNIKPKLVVLNDESRILFFATRDIVKGEELLYDYNDRSKEAMLAHPWLSTWSFSHKTMASNDNLLNSLLS